MSGTPASSVDASSAIPPMRLMSGLNPATATREQCETALNMISQEMGYGGYVIKQGRTECVITPDARTKDYEGRQLFLGMLFAMQSRIGDITSPDSYDEQVVSSYKTCAEILNRFAQDVDRKNDRNPAAKGSLFERISTELNPQGITEIPH